MIIDFNIMLYIHIYIYIFLFLVSVKIWQDSNRFIFHLRLTAEAQPCESLQSCLISCHHKNSY